MEDKIFGTDYTLEVWIWPAIQFSTLLPRPVPQEEMLNDLGSHFDWTPIWLNVALWWAVAFIGALAWRIRKPNIRIDSDRDAANHADR